MPDSKIFIDTDEEITFIIDKIKQSATQNVAVIVPDRASIFITSASLKLLQKSIEKLNKKVILVTMDETGKKMAESMGMITAYRVRDVTSELWDLVKKNPIINKKPVSQKNNVIRDIPKELVELDKPLQLQIKNEDVLENEPVLPAANEEKFEYPNSSQVSNNDETLVEPSSIQNNNSSYLSSDEENISYLLTDESALNVDEELREKENSVGILDEIDNFKIPENNESNVSSEVEEMKNSQSENIDINEFLFVYGEDILESDILKKKVQLIQINPNL